MKPAVHFETTRVQQFFINYITFYFSGAPIIHSPQRWKVQQYESKGRVARFACS